MGISIRQVVAVVGLAGLATMSLRVGAQTSAQPLDSNDIDALNKALQQQRDAIQHLQDQVQSLEDTRNTQTSATTATPSASGVTSGYDSGFFVKDASGNNELYINGLIQPRFNRFSTIGTAALGGTDRSVSNFDIFLGRLYFSGNVVDPSYKFFFTLQGTTTGNGSGLTLLDAEVSKTWSPYLKVEAGRYWSAYTYEYYDDIAKYLLPDLSAAEWGFSLGRQIGARVSGKADRVAYSLSVSNSIPGSDVGNNENLGGRVATIANLYIDLLEPYGYQETDPGRGNSKPQLSLWLSGMYNPVQYSSVFENELANDITYGATTSLNFRYGGFSFQGSGYYRDDRSQGSTYASHALQEQLGYYLVPGQWELAERVDHVHWGRGEIPQTGGEVTTWYAGPSNFSYENLTEYTGGVNYYLAGHSAKLQLDYSYIPASGFEGERFHANRILAQVQLAF